MRARRLLSWGLVAAAALLPAAPERAHAAGGCAHAVVLTLPGVTWQAVDRVRPPQILAAARHGAVGAVSVRSIGSTTSYPDAYATIGGGARLNGGSPATSSMPGTRGAVSGGALFQRNVPVGGAGQIRRLADAAGYDARPGALARALGDLPLVAVGNADEGMPPPVPRGLARWPLLAAMDPRGIVAVSATGPRLSSADPSAPFGVRTDPEAIRGAIDRALDIRCSTTIVDAGDLDRADSYARLVGSGLPGREREALMAADSLVGYLRQRLGPGDLLLLVTPTSPSWADKTHLGVAIAEGPGFRAGSSLVSASTRRAGTVTLPDVAPTVLALEHRTVTGSMDGRPMRSVAAVSPDRMKAAISLDEESVYVDSLKGRFYAGYIGFQMLVYVLAIVLLVVGQMKGRSFVAGGAGRSVALASLALLTFPVACYLAGVVDAYRLGTVTYTMLIAGIDLVVVAGVVLVLRGWLDRLLALAAFTVLVTFVDLAVGAPLELNTIFGYSPIVAGRFTGLGNTGFAVLGGAVIIVGALVVHRFPRSRAAFAGVAALFVITVLFDGAPQLGSDVGGVLAFTPALGLTLLLLLGRRPSPGVVLAALGAALLVLAAFLAVDLARPVQQQTHLARLFEAIKARGIGVFVDTIARKAEANLRIFRQTLFTYLFPPALAVMAVLVLRPRGRWQRLAEAYPRVRAGLIGGLVLAVLGFAVNDSGIVIPAMMLSFFVPLAFLVHMEIERADHEVAATGGGAA